MKKVNGTKIKLLKLLEILQSESDEDNSLSTTEIIEKLAERGISCDRNTVYRDIKKLNESGMKFCAIKESGNRTDIGLWTENLPNPNFVY